MSVHVDVTLLSGRSISIEADLTSSVAELMQEAQQLLQIGPGMLVRPSGEVLCGRKTLGQADLHDGEVLTLQVGQTQVAASLPAFAALIGGSVVSWGRLICGGDSSTVQSQLHGVQRIQASGGAFAAILDDGSVVTWGHADYGGDSAAVQEQLRDVCDVQASVASFAAVSRGGSVVTWGSADFGGDSSSVRHQLKDVHHIQACRQAFAAIRGDGSSSILCRGESFLAELPWPSKESSALGVKARMRNLAGDRLCDVQQIQATAGAFTAVLGDGSAVTWGHPDFGGDSRGVQSRLRGVLHVQEKLKHVLQIQSTDKAFAAILADGSVVTWGDPDYGGDCSALEEQLVNVQQIQASRRAFAAVLASGGVVTWGNPDLGGDSSKFQEQLRQGTGSLNSAPETKKACFSALSL
ncbi:HERC2 [Symbiodinium sp. KB8]|nr:HERC2 [Symbiodinium sp. KB8]